MRTCTPALPRTPPRSMGTQTPVNLSIALVARPPYIPHIPIPHIFPNGSEGAPQTGSTLSPPFCTDINDADVDSACACWCPSTHGRSNNNTGLCIPLADMPAGKSQGTKPTDRDQIGKTNVDGGGGDVGSDDGGNTTGGDGDVPPPTSKSSTALVVGIIVPLLIVVAIGGYMIGARKKGHATQRTLARSRGPPAKINSAYSASVPDGGGGGGDDTYVEPVSISDQNQNGPNQHAGIGANGPGAVPPTLDAGDPYDMPNDFNQQGVRISGTAASTSAAAGAGAPIDDPYDMPNDFNQQGVHIDQAQTSGQQQPFYDEASATGQATYSLAQQNNPGHIKPFTSETVLDDAYEWPDGGGYDKPDLYGGDAYGSTI